MTVDIYIFLRLYFYRCFNSLNIFKVDRETKSSELKASVDSVLQELEREVIAHASQHSDDSDNDKQHKTDKKHKNKKKKKLKDVKKLEKVKKLIEKIKKDKKIKKKKKTKKATKNKDGESVNDSNLDESMDTSHDTSKDDHDQNDKSLDTSEDREENSADCVAPPLSSSGMNKLFALAGYQTSEKEKLIAKDESKKMEEPKSADNEKEAEKMEEKTDETVSDRSPINVNKILQEKVSPPNPLRFSFKKSSPGIGFHNKLLSPEQDDSPVLPKLDSSRDPTPENLHAPLHHADDSENTPEPATEVVENEDKPLVRESKSPSPIRLPKMRDSRSPAKVPIMRDQRSPIRQPDNNFSEERSMVDHPNDIDTRDSGDRRDYDKYRDNYDSYDSRRKYVSPRRGERDHNLSPRKKHDVSMDREKEYSPRNGYSPKRYNDKSPRKLSPGVKDHSSTRRDSPGRYRSPPRGSTGAQRRDSPRRDHISTPRKSSSGRLSPRMNDYDSRPPRSPRRYGHDDGYNRSRDRPLSPTPRSPNNRPMNETRSNYSPRYRRESTDRRSPRGYSPRRYSPHGPRSGSRGEGYRRSRERDRHSPSRYGHSPRYDRRRLSPNARSPPRRSPGRYSPRNRYGSPYSPPRQGYGRDDSRRLSPTRHVSPSRRLSHSRRSSSIRRASPPLRRPSPRVGSPRKWMSPPPGGRRSPYNNRSPMRGYSPRGRSPGGRYRRSPERFDKAVSPSYRRSPMRQDHPSYVHSPRPDMRPDSTIPDSELSGHNQQYPSSLVPPLSALLTNDDYSDSPKRLSLDERLERELGLERDEHPPPLQPPMIPAVSGKSAITLPTSIPTYDDQYQSPLPGILCYSYILYL